MLLRESTSVPTIYALSRARRYLDSVGSNAELVITGGLRVSSDFAKALALGADAIAIASAALIAAACQQYRICGTGNCPVGVAWIGLNLPGYGLHGTPRPESIGFTGSHGCFRLANWNAARLYAMCRPGTKVVVER